MTESCRRFKVLFINSMTSNHYAFRILLMTLAFCLGSSALAYRAVVSFSVTGFDEAVPEVAMAGSIEVELNDTTKEEVAVIAITLSINGHAFEISELGFSEYRNFNIVGAQGDGMGSPTGISHSSPYDFWILWNKDSGLPKEFAFTGASEKIHSSKQFAFFSIEAVE